MVTAPGGQDGPRDAASNEPGRKAGRQRQEKLG